MHALPLLEELYTLFGDSKVKNEQAFMHAYIPKAQITANGE